MVENKVIELRLPSWSSNALNYWPKNAAQGLAENWGIIQFTVGVKIYLEKKTKLYLNFFPEKTRQKVVDTFQFSLDYSTL